ncbi:MAG TPA: chemotaxis protein CheW [Alphaproteobacteria bacterium]|nr:chemotaxis protein CheW [Alphaproteobacteria bacterium]
MGKQPTDCGAVVGIFVADQLFGVPILAVRDVLGPQRITRIPLAPPEVAGVLNLRGRIVTAIDMRRRLGLQARWLEDSCMSVVVENGDELYSLIVDSVADVLNLPAEGYERNPFTLDPHWREISAGVCQLEGRLMVVLDVDDLIHFQHMATA